MPSLHPSNYPLDEAIRRGMTTVVAYQMDRLAQMHAGGYGPSGFYRQDKAGETTYIPFEMALESKRWACALEIYRYRDQVPGVVPKPDEEDRDEGVALRDTVPKKALDYLLMALDEYRPGRRLVPALVDKVRALVQEVAGQEGPDATLLRVLAHQPPWLGASRWLLEAGAGANAYWVSGSGYTMHALTTAGARGLESDFMALLDAGGRPDWRHYDNDQVIHRIVDLSWHPLERGGVADLDGIQARLRCAQALLERAPGVGAARGTGGRTVEQARQAGWEWLKRQRPDPGADAAQAAAWNARKMDLLLPGQDPQPQRARPRF